jgi:hypothetical protein
MHNNQAKYDGTRVWSTGNTSIKKPLASAYKKEDNFARPKIGVWHAPDVVQKMEEKGLMNYDDSNKSHYRSG